MIKIAPWLDPRFQILKSYCSKGGIDKILEKYFFKDKFEL
jgi:hypothetical protein